MTKGITNSFTIALIPGEAYKDLSRLLKLNVDPIAFIKHAFGDFE